MAAPGTPAPKPKALFSISKSTIRTLVPVGVALAADRLMTHESAVAVVVAIGAGVAAAVWGALDWLDAHTVIGRLVDLRDDGGEQ